MLLLKQILFYDILIKYNIKILTKNTAKIVMTAFVTFIFLRHYNVGILSFEIKDNGTEYPGKTIEISRRRASIFFAIYDDNAARNGELRHGHTGEAAKRTNDGSAESILPVPE